MTIQFDKLNDVRRATELLSLGGFNMEEVVCGTAGCLIGNYNALVKRDLYRFARGDWKHFGITKSEYGWLFQDCAIPKVYLDTDWENKAGRNLRHVSRDEALARLLKFIAYKRRKHELIYDPKYGVRDEARHAEGDQMFAVLAVQDALAEMSLATAN